MSLPLGLRPATFTQSKKWIAPNIASSKQYERINAARQKFCKNSVAWTHNFDRDQHRQDFEQYHQELLDKQEYREFKEKKARRAGRTKYNIPATPVVALGIRSLLADKMVDGVWRRSEDFVPAFHNNFSTVLCRPTAFSFGRSIKRTDPNWEKGEVPKPEPEFPILAEMRYEGDERIATDMLHRRFLGAPRVPGNHTVNWSQASIIPQYPFDDARPHWEHAIRRMPSAHEGMVVEDLMFHEYEWDGRPCAGELAVTDEGVYLLDANLLEYLDD